MKRINKKQATSTKLFKNKIAAAFAIAVLTTVFAFLPTSLASSEPRTQEARKEAATATVQAAPELPREWVWQRKALNFDHMFRSKR